MKPISLNLPKNLVEQLDERKEKTGIDRNSQIRQAVAEKVGEID